MWRLGCAVLLQEGWQKESKVHEDRAVGPKYKETNCMGQESNPGLPRQARILPQNHPCSNKTASVSHQHPFLLSRRQPRT